ncbi:MAG: substrate-binding domain-containing protein [Anaerolineae bacterium]|jgi:multiple sugar transport system substrate-binding protein|nr:substrate-binding domain-containing protein [Anaerolineae bacterium]
MSEKKSKLSRREFLKLGGSGLAAAAFLSACGGAQPTQAPAPAAPAAEATTAPAAAPTTAPAAKAAMGPIEFLAWGDTTDGPAWEKLGPAYTAKTGNVVNITPVADPNANFYTKLQTMFAGGTPPHLSSFQGWEWQTYQDKDLLQAVDEWIARDNATAAYPAGFTSVEQSTKRGGKTYLIPLQAGVMVMFYAKRIFDEAGVAYPKDDWTFDQFVETAQKLTDAGKGTFGYQVNGNWFRDIGWIVGTGKREFDNIIDPTKAQFNTKEIVDRITTTSYDMPNTYKAAPSPADTSGAYTINNGNCAMKYEGPWFLPQLNSQKLRDEKKEVPFDVVRMPATPGVAGRPHRGWGEGVAVTKTDMAEAAWAFAAYLISEEGNKIYSETTGRIPSNVELATTWWVPRTKELYQIENGQAFLDAFKEGQIDVVSVKAPRSKMWSEVVKPTAWDAINNGSAKPADVFPQVDEKLNALLSA